MNDTHGLYTAGCDRMEAWCGVNGVRAPMVHPFWEGEPDFGVCAYYRDDVIHIWPRHCARVGMVGRAWSYPGYVVDRTPFGVIQHELGHHVEHAHGARGGVFAAGWKSKTGEEAITSYAPNVNEWFAEMFRLFVTNPHLLMLLRPNTYALLITQWPAVVEKRSWAEVLATVPRQFKAAQNKINEVERKMLRGRKLF